MKILAIGDLHYKSTNTPIMPQVEQSLIDLAKEHSPDKIVLLGDILDRHETVHTDHLNAAMDFIIRLSAIAVTYVLIGNHDLSSNRVFLEDRHALNGLKGRANIKIIDSPLKEDGCLFVPYVPNGRFLEAIGDLHSDVSVVFCHQEFKGAAFGNMRSESPDEWAFDAPLVISGHIHERQELQPNLVYAGTPFQQAFGESVDKTVCLLEVSKEGIELQHVRTNVPKRITLEITIDEVSGLEINPNDLYRIQVKCPTASSWQAFRKTKEYKKLLAMNIKVMPVTDKPAADKHTLTSRKSYLQVLQELVNQEPSGAKMLNSVLQELVS